MESPPSDSFVCSGAMNRAGKMPAPLDGSWRALFRFFRMHWDHEPVRSLVAANRRRMIPPLLGERAGVREIRAAWEAREEFGGAEGCGATERAGASESIFGFGNVLSEMHKCLEIPNHPSPRQPVEGGRRGSRERNRHLKQAVGHHRHVCGIHPFAGKQIRRGLQVIR